MKELDLLKQHWQKSANSFDKIDTNTISKIIHKKSSSIAKWLFYISIIEMLFWLALNQLAPLFMEENQSVYDAIYGGKTTLQIFEGIGYTVILIFSYLLYKSYKEVDSTQSIKKLLNSILKIRKIVKYYVIYNLVGIVISFMLGAYIGIVSDNNIQTIVNEANPKELLFFYIITGTVLIIFLLIIMVVFWLFYRLIYGILVKRLNKNYVELKKLEA